MGMLFCCDCLAACNQGGGGAVGVLGWLGAPGGVVAVVTVPAGAAALKWALLLPLADSGCRSGLCAACMWAHRLPWGFACVCVSSPACFIGGGGLLLVLVSAPLHGLQPGLL